jgi:hypothetical protein
MREGTLIVLTSDPDEVGLVAHRRFIPTSRPRDGRIAHTAAWRGFTITDRRHEFAHRSHHIHSAHRRGESPSVEDLRGQRTIWSHDQEHTDGGCRTGKRTTDSATSSFRSRHALVIPVRHRHS